MKINGPIPLLLAGALLAFAPDARAQESEEPALYVSVECMQATGTDYLFVETNLWLPVHQALVDQGMRNSWALYEVAFGDRSDCDYYTVTTYLGEEQLNAEPRYDAVFAEVHSSTRTADAFERTYAARDRLSTELWRTIDSTEIGAHRYAVINRMHAEDPLTYEQMESRVFKAAHQMLIDEGHRAGWAVYELVAPAGTAVPWNYATVDLMDEIGPVPMADAMLAANPDRDLEELQELLDVREQVHSEIWTRIATTTPASED